jgi:hypothetical protein
LVEPVSSLAVLTPSYEPDFELCGDLNRSVLEWTPPEVAHHIIVPDRDRALFGRLSGPRTAIWTINALLPRRMLPVPKANMWVNLRRPFPPIRGWVMQQLLKLHVATVLDADLLLLADSDVVLARPVTPDTFVENGRVRFYRSDDAVHAGMTRHVIWHDVARRLLGLPSADSRLFADYVSAFNVWERTVVCALKEHVEAIAGRSWLDVIAAQLHVSEFILYGAFVDLVLGEAANVQPDDRMLVHSYWEPSPLSPDAASEFVHSLLPNDVAVMISAKSGTALDVRRAALSDLPSIVAA